MAHVVVYGKLRAGRQREFPVEENLYLICAASVDEAYAEAESWGREYAAANQDLRWNEQPACMVFAGVRKLIACEGEQRPGDGDELTYSRHVVHSEERVNALASGAPVTVLYEE